MGNLINIKNYPVPHKNQNGGTGGGVTYVTYNGSSSSSNNGDNVNATYIMASDGKILRLEGEELTYNYGKIGELESDNIIAGKINADEMDVLKAWIEKLDSKEITTEYLTVTKQAHFFELIIDKVRAVGGQIILTPAQAAIDKVFAYDSNDNLVSDPISYFNSVSYFDVYWRALDSEGRGISNDWVAGDQAYCQSFNVTAGVHHDVSNKYYWRLVNAVLPDKMINFSTNEIQDVLNPTTNVTTNNISISMEYTTYEDVPTNISWEVRPMVEHAGVEWDDVGPNATYAVRGTMSTSSTSLGINILPTGDYAYIPSDTLKFHIYNVDGNIAQSNINIGVYFKDGTSIFFPNVEFDSNFNKTLDLKSPDMEIEAIAIVCTQPVQWNQCHGIRLSNTDMDHYVDAKGATPETGDNIVQLGYRPNDDANRRSAIIIAAYKTPDPDLTAPSYAQYIGINDYNLKSHRQSYFDANGAKFLGDITLAKVNANGKTISQLVIDQDGLSASVNGLSGQVASFQMTVNGFNATVNSYTNAVNGYNSQVASFQMTVNGFNTTVGKYTESVNGYKSEVASFQHTVDGFNTTVGKYTSAVNGYSQQYSQVTQNYNNIKAEVYNDINGKLTTTGINITNGTILLKANKVTFADAYGGNTDKISIDPLYGTLKAVNATLSGELTIQQQNSNDGLRLNSSGNIERYNGSSWVNLFAQRNVRYVYGSSATCTAQDDIILVGTSGLQLNLPSSPTSGRQITVRNVGTGNYTTIYGNPYTIVRGGAKTGDNRDNYIRLNNDDRAEFVYYDNKWYWNAYGT